MPLYCRFSERGKQGLELVALLELKGDSAGCTPEAFPTAPGWFVSKSRPGMYAA